MKNVSPSATVTAEKVFTSPERVRLKPDVVVDYGDRVIIAGVAVVWDDQERFLNNMCLRKISKYCLSSLFGGSPV